MKKLLLLIPVGLLAATGIFWITLDPTTTPANDPKTEQMPQGVRDLFSRSESSLRKIIRHGDKDSIPIMDRSLKAITTKVSEYQKDGYPTAKLEEILSIYKRDSTLLTQKITPRLERLHQYDQFQYIHEKPFITSIDQIGLYELKTAYNDLDKIRNRYLKEPSPDSKIAYETENKRLHEIINELYLDTSIEKPLFDYLDNHKHYFEMISAAYEEIGYERIHRLRTNAYAIKSELQLLPSI